MVEAFTKKQPLSRSYHILLVLAMIVIIWAAWSFLGPVISPKEACNIVLISIDTCRADYLSCYGYSRKTTPNIDDIAGVGILFENVITPVPITLPAHCSTLTGTTPLYHQVHDNLGYKLGSSNVTLAEIMRDHGYKTGAIISSFVLDSQFGLEQGFDSYNDSFEEEIKTGRFSERRGGETSRFAVTWLQGHKDDTFFLFLHYFDPHFRYEPPEPFASEFADNLYAGEIAYTDYCIAQVIQKLKDLHLYDSTLLIITADHGEMLGEHGESEHGYFIYQSAIKVPLIFKLPGRNKSRRINSLVSLNDIMPTICSLLDIQPPQHIQGKDLSGYFTKKKIADQQSFVYCESITPTKHNANALLGIVTDRWKYIQTTRPELYNLNKDPEEKSNLVEKEPQRAHLLREHLRLILLERPPKSDSDSKSELDEQTRKRLESLGYIASGSVDDRLELDQSRQDPKDLIKFHNIKAYNEMATLLVQQGKLKEAAEAWEKLIQHYEKAEIKHDMATIHFNLAETLKRLGQQQQSTEQFVKAAEQFRLELAENPDSSLLWTRLGDTLATMGDFKGAAQAFRKSLALNPANLLYYDNLVKALQYQGRLAEAIEVLQKGVEFMSRHGQIDAAAKLKKYLDLLKYQKSKQEK